VRYYQRDELVGPSGEAALFGQELDALRCSGSVLDFITTFPYLALDFPVLGPRLFTTSSLVVIDFQAVFNEKSRVAGGGPSRKS